MLRWEDCRVDMNEEISGKGKTNYIREFLSIELSNLKERAEVLSSFSHGATIGEAREALLRDLIRRLLPERYGLVSGIVTDIFGNQSPQLDAVVIDRSVIPPIMLAGESAAIPIEAAVLSIEIKTTVNPSALEQIRRQADALQNMFKQIKGTQSLPLSLFGLKSDISSEFVKDFMIRYPRFVSACVLSDWTLLLMQNGVQTVIPHPDSEHLPGIAYMGMTIAILDEACKTRNIESPSGLWKTYLMGPDMWNERLQRF